MVSNEESLAKLKEFEKILKKMNPNLDVIRNDLYNLKENVKPFLDMMVEKDAGTSTLVMLWFDHCAIPFEETLKEIIPQLEAFRSTAVVLKESFEERRVVYIKNLAKIRKKSS